MLDSSGLDRDPVYSVIDIGKRVPLTITSKKARFGYDGKWPRETMT